MWQHAAPSRRQEFSQALVLRKPLLRLEDCAICFIFLDPLVCTSLVMAISLPSPAEPATSSSYIVGFLVVALVVEALDFFCLALGGGVTCFSSDSASSIVGSCIFSFPFLEELVETALAFLDFLASDYGGVGSTPFLPQIGLVGTILLRATGSED